MGTHSEMQRPYWEVLWETLLQEREGGCIEQREKLQCYCEGRLSSASKDFWSRHRPSELFQAMRGLGHFSPHQLSIAESCPVERAAAVGKAIP